MTLDLAKPTEYEGWVNIYETSLCGPFDIRMAHETKADALIAAKESTSQKHLATIKIKFREGDGLDNPEAAIPELIAALEDAVEKCRVCGGSGEKTFRLSPPDTPAVLCSQCGPWRAALAKAEGRKRVSR